MDRVSFPVLHLLNHKLGRNPVRCPLIPDLHLSIPVLHLLNHKLDRNPVLCPFIPDLRLSNHKLDNKDRDSQLRHSQLKDRHSQLRTQYTGPHISLRIITRLQVLRQVYR
jgi:hypothetical protein